MTGCQMHTQHFFTLHHRVLHTASLVYIWMLLKLQLIKSDLTLYHCPSPECLGGQLLEGACIFLSSILLKTAEFVFQY